MDGPLEAPVVDTLNAHNLVSFIFTHILQAAAPGHGGGTKKASYKLHPLTDSTAAGVSGHPHTHKAKPLHLKAQ